MGTAQIRQRLHEIIDNAEDKKLKAIYTLLEEDTYEGYGFSEDQKKELDRRLEDYQNGKGKTYTWEEAVAITDRALQHRLEMLKLSDEDIKAGRLISQQKVDNDDREWLKNCKFD